jgi:hypothetical protein
MKTKVLLAITACFLVFALAYAQKEEQKDKAKDKETGIAGKWATDAVRDAVPDKKSDSFTTRLLQQAGDVAVSRVPTGRGPGGGGPGGRPRSIDMSDAVVLEKGSSPGGPALILDLKLNKNKLTGEVMEVVSGAKVDVEEASVTGSTFKFTTYKKVVNVKVATIYKGELVDESTISLTRWSNSDKAVDTNPDGSVQPLIFKRAPK